MYQRENEFLWNEIEKNSSFFRHKASSAIMSLAQGVLWDLQDGTEGRVVLAGEEGCGKTVLFSFVCEELKRKGWTVLPILCQATSFRCTPIDIMKSLVWQMEEVSGAQHDMDFSKLGEISGYKEGTYAMEKNRRAMAELQKRFAELCTKYTTKIGKHLIIAVDALDLSFQGRTWEETEFIPHLITKHIRVFCTCDQECVSPEDAVRKMMTEFSGGKIEDSWKKIRKKGLKAYKGAIEGFDNIALQKICEYVAAAPDGLRYDNLQALFTTEGIDITREQLMLLVKQTGALFLVRADGHICLAHAGIREGILASCSKTQNLYTAVAKHLKTLPDTDELRKNGFTTALIQADDKEALIEFIISLAVEEAKQFWYPTGMELFVHIFTEGNNWIASVVDSLNQSKRENMDKLKFISFFTFQVWDCFVGIPKEALYKKRLAEILIAAVEMILKQEESVYANFLCGVLYDFMGEILYRASGPERPENALEWYEKEAAVYEHMLVVYGPAYMGNLRAAFDKIEKINIRQGDASHIEKASYYFQKEALLSEKIWAITKDKDDFLMLSLSLEKCADFLTGQGGKENLDHALVCAMRSLSIRAVLSQGLPDPLESLPVSYATIANVYYRLGGKENIQKALEFRETEIRLWKRIIKKNRIERFLRNLSNAYNSLGGLYLEQGGPDNLEKAQKNFELSFQIMEELLNLTGTVGSLRNLYVAYYKLGDVYAYYGERDTMIAARHYFGKAQEICERLNAELKTQESKNDLEFIKQHLSTLQSKLDSYGKQGKKIASDAQEEGVSAETLLDGYRKAGEQYEEKGGKENLLLAIEQYTSELSLLQSQEAENSTTEGRMAVAEAHLRIGSVHEQIDTREELQNALRHYSTALQLIYKLDNESSGIRTQRALATAYIYRSSCCERMGSREDVWIARDGFVQAKALREKIYDKLHDEQSRKELEYCEHQLERLEKIIKQN